MRQDEPLSQPDIDELENYLLSDAVSEECMDIAMLHGFLTALVAGPSAVLPSEWLPVVWGDDDGPEFDSIDEANRILDLIMRMNNSISKVLQDDPLSFLPIIYEEANPEGKMEYRAEEWCKGFAMGTHLRASEWDVLVSDNKHYILMVPILALASEKAMEEVLASSNEKKLNRDELMANLPVAVAGIYEYWRPRRMEHAGHVTAESSRFGRVGRNQPCTCGSGKKFKKCCGRGGK